MDHTPESKEGVIWWTWWSLNYKGSRH